jgi:hypothetical protein
LAALFDDLERDPETAFDAHDQPARRPRASAAAPKPGSDMAAPGGLGGAVGRRGIDRMKAHDRARRDIVPGRKLRFWEHSY